LVENVGVTATEEALAEALNVIFDLVKELEEQPQRARYYAEQVRALRAEIETQYAVAERLREEKQQMQVEYGRLKQLAERERDEHRRAAESASRDIEALRRHNAELSTMKCKTEGKMRQLQAELVQLRHRIEKKLELDPKTVDASVSRRVARQTATAVPDQVLAKTQDSTDAKQKSGQLCTRGITSLVSAPNEEMPSKQQERATESIRVSFATKTDVARIDPEKASQELHNDGFGSAAKRSQVQNEYSQHKIDAVPQMELEALRRDCEWLRHQLDWYKSIISEQEELLTFAIQHR
jgi:hypothetical protein